MRLRLSVVRSFFLLQLVLLGCISFGQEVKLKLPSAGTYDVWTGTEPPDPAQPKRIEGAEGSVTGSGDTVYVWDRTSGNLASKPLKGLSQWSLTAVDFKRIGRLVVRVEHEGKPVAAASVGVKGRPPQVLDSSSGGEVPFYGLPPGDTKVEVAYRSGGKQAEPLRQSIEVGLKRSQPEPKLVISVPDEVETVSEAVAPTTKPSEPTPATSAKAPPEREARGAFGSVIVYLVALVLAAVGGWFLYNWMKKNQDTVKQKLQHYGVDIPEPGQAPDPDPAPAPIPIVPQPPQKIILDDAAPTAPIPSPAGFVSTGAPCFISDSGNSVKLEEGIGFLGREDGLLYSFTSESTISRKHAQITRSGSAVSVKDLGSTNGTFVNGVRIDGEANLQPGDSVQFGAMKFRFEG